jgi:hypothetical protein
MLALVQDITHGLTALFMWTKQFGMCWESGLELIRNGRGRVKR